MYSFCINTGTLHITQIDTHNSTALARLTVCCEGNYLPPPLPDAQCRYSQRQNTRFVRVRSSDSQKMVQKSKNDGCTEFKTLLLEVIFYEKNIKRSRFFQEFEKKYCILCSVYLIPIFLFSNNNLFLKINISLYLKHFSTNNIFMPHTVFKIYLII